MGRVCEMVATCRNRTVRLKAAVFVGEEIRGVRWRAREIGLEPSGLLKERCADPIPYGG